MQNGRGRDLKPEKPSGVPDPSFPICDLNSATQSVVGSQVQAQELHVPGPWQDKELGPECKSPSSSITLFSSAGSIL